MQSFTNKDKNKNKNKIMLFFFNTRLARILFFEVRVFIYSGSVKNFSF